MTMPPRLRKFALIVHLTSSVGWIGAVIAYLALGLSAVNSGDSQTVRAAWIAMESTGWMVIIPMAIAALLTGLIMSLGTQLGLFRHYWVLLSFVLTILCTVVLLLHMPSVTALTNVARTADGADLHRLGGDLFHPAVGCPPKFCDDHGTGEMKGRFHGWVGRGRPWTICGGDAWRMRRWAQLNWIGFGRDGGLGVGAGAGCRASQRARWRA